MSHSQKKFIRRLAKHFCQLKKNDVMIFFYSEIFFSFIQMPMSGFQNIKKKNNKKCNKFTVAIQVTKTMDTF